MTRDGTVHQTDAAVRKRRDGLTDHARRRHDALTAAIDGLERALAAPAATRAKPWSERVATEFDLVREAIVAHATNVEEPDGLFDEIQLAQPRLATRVAELKEEHASLLAHTDALARRVPADHDADFGALRRNIASLLTALRAHRGEEADLVYEAFWTDLGAGD